MIYNRLVILIFSLIISVNVFSQGQEGYWWFFGQNAGAEWCTTGGLSPTAITGSLTTSEGCASIGDGFCNLLFYTDGITIWNNIHLQMPNGFGLHGDPSATQSGVIVPQPLNPYIYYVFTVDANLGTYGCQYSMVDMNLSGGLGDVTTVKNVPLFSPSSEKIAAVNHANGFDMWVITHPFNSQSFQTYLVTSAGITNLATPVISTVGAMYTGGSNVTRGYLKPNNTGSMIAAAIEGLDMYELFNFNNFTGELTHIVSMQQSGKYQDAYGVEFSPDGNFLYGSCRWDTPVYQWDVSSGIGAQILLSEVQIATLSTSNGGALQLAPDQKIYLARNSQNYLGVINSPNDAGLLCNYVEPGLTLLPGTMSREGISTFSASFFNVAEYTYINQCHGDTTYFTISNLSFVDSVYWHFDDPINAPYDTSNVMINPYYVFSEPGLYDVTLITWRAGYSDTAMERVRIHEVPDVNLNDTVICLGTTVTLDAGYYNMEYFWNNGKTTKTINVTPNDTTSYFVEVNNNGCMGSDTCTIYPYFITSDFTADPIACANDPTTVTYLGNADPSATYNWGFNGASVNSGAGPGPYNINWQNPGDFTISLSVQQGTCFSDQTILTLNNPPSLDIEIDGIDVSCKGDETGEIYVTPTGGDGSPMDYLWNTGVNSQDLIGVGAGTYSIVITYNGQCTQEASFTITEPATEVTATFNGEDITCNGETSGWATVSGSGGTGSHTYLWNENNASTTTITNLGAGYYTCTITDELGCTYVGGQLINEPLPIYMFGTPEQYICEGEDATIFVTATGGIPPYSYSWKSENTTWTGAGDTLVVTPDNSDKYVVSLVDAAGCEAGFASAEVIIHPPVKTHAYIFNDSICPGESTMLFATFTGGNGGPYTAYDEDGELVELPMTITPEETTTYTVEGVDNCGSPSSPTQVTVYLMEVPEPDFEADIFVGCEPLTVNFDYLGTGDNLNYLWRFKGGSEPEYENGNTPEHTFDEVGIYDVDLKVSNEWGCHATVEKLQMIEVLEGPEADFLPDHNAVPITKPVVFIQNLSSANIVKSYWNMGDGTQMEGDFETIQHIYGDTGTYNITLIVEREYDVDHLIDPLSCYDTLTLDVQVYEENVFFAPNAFNPYSLNTENAVFNPMLYGQKISNYHLVIMDRWGEKVYETFSLDHGWDGKIKNGEVGRPDVYTWIVKYTDINGHQQIQTGNVALVR